MIQALEILFLCLLGGAFVFIFGGMAAVIRGLFRGQK